MKLIKLFGWAMIGLLASASAHAMPITYYDSNFEDGGLGGGESRSSIFGEATNISSSNLDGRALLFDLNDQMFWDLNGPDSNYHYVSFDYFASSGANITQFLDVPSILRSDIGTPGRHSVDLYYDYGQETVTAFLDGVLMNDLPSILAWPAFDDPATRGMRIANQVSGPGNSTGIFEIDNLLWQGNVRQVPEPGLLVLLLTGLLGMFVFKNRSGFVKRVNIGGN